MAFKTIRFILTLRCEESTKLVSDSLDRKLTSGERLAVKLHQIGCWSCRRFGRHMALIRKAMRRGDQEASIRIEPSLSPAARQRIKDALSRTAAGDC